MCWGKRVHCAVRSRQAHSPRPTCRLLRYAASRSGALCSGERYTGPTCAPGARWACTLGLGLRSEQERTTAQGTRTPAPRLRCGGLASADAQRSTCADAHSTAAWSASASTAPDIHHLIRPLPHRVDDKLGRQVTAMRDARFTRGAPHARPHLWHLPMAGSSGKKGEARSRGVCCCVQPVQQWSPAVRGRPSERQSVWLMACSTDHQAGRGRCSRP